MNPSHPTQPSLAPLDEPDETDEARLPCAIGLLAATLALMTGHATPAPGASVDTATLQRLTARKIVSNLYFLQQHPQLPPGLRQVASQLHSRWCPLAQPDDARAALVSAAGGASGLH